MVNWFAINVKGKGLGKLISKLILATVVYVIWRERNARIFRNDYKDVVTISKDVVDCIRFKLH